MSQGDRIKQITNLYSMGLLPKIEGRYLTHFKRKKLPRLARQSDFSIEKAKVRLNTELKKIQLSERINNRSERRRSQGICFTEPTEDSSRSEIQTIHIKSIGMQTSNNPAVSKAPSLFVYRKKQNDSLALTDGRPSFNLSPPSKLTSQHPLRNILKIKIGKQPLDDGKEEDFSATLSKWMETVQVEAHYSYNCESISKRQQDGVILQKHEGMRAVKHMKLKLKYLDNPGK